jgi:predicted nucleic acid-binding Zn ribbon protein
MLRRPLRPQRPLGPPKLTPEQRVLAQWRGIDLSAAEKKLRPSAHAIADVMPKVLTELRIDRRQSEAEIARVWNNLIDPRITAHAQPTGIHKGTLFVNVDSNVWLDEIVRYRRKEILDRLQHSFGKDVVTRISFRLG